MVSGSLGGVLVEAAALWVKLQSMGGAGVNVVAFSLWGEGPMYWAGALRNAELVERYYPGWRCRFYVDDASPARLIEGLARCNVDIVRMGRREAFDGAFWRFLPASDPEVDVMLSRDCDSRISDREVAAVAEWILSDKDFHIMRDHPCHDVPILGGMWGCRHGLLRDMEQMIKRWSSSLASKGCDQEFLAAEVYPRVRGRSFEHSELGPSFDGQVSRFPTPRRAYEFVGDVFDERDARDGEFWRLVREHVDRVG